MFIDKASVKHDCKYFRRKIMLSRLAAQAPQAPQAPPPFLLMDIFPGPLGWFNSTDVSFIPGVEQRLEKS